MAPRRILDTRSGLGAPRTPAKGGSVLGLAVAGRGGVPATGAGAVVLNLTVAGSTANGHVTVSPTDTGSVGTSTINYTTFQTVANLVTVGLGPDGGVDLRVTSPGTVRLVADVVGWVAAGAPTAPLGASPVTPTRLLDTRAAGGGGKVTGGTRRSVVVTGRAGVPASGVGTALLNVTVADATFDGHVQVVARGAGLPVSSTLNFQALRTKASFVAAPVAADGAVDLAVSRGGTVRLVVDVMGYVLGPPADTTPPPPVAALTATASGTSGVSLSWTPPAGSDATGVVIRRLPGADPPATSTSGTMVADVALPATTVKDTGRAPGTTYSYAAFAHDTVPNLTATGAGATVATTPLSWTAAATVSARYGRPADVSCPTATWCLAVGQYGDSWVWSAGSWAPAGSLAESDDPMGFTAVSCPTTTFCLATLFNSRVATWNGGSWSVTSTAIPFADVSCWSTTGCGLAAAVEEQGTPEFARWTSGKIGGFVSISGRDGAHAISCPTSVCTIVTTTGSAATRESSYAHTITGSSVATTWIGYGYRPHVSCVTATWCMAVVDRVYRTGAGSSWSAAKPAQMPDGAGIFSGMNLSCATKTSCTFVGPSSATQLDGVVAARWNGTSWSMKEIGGGINTGRSVDCASSSTCMVVDERGRFTRWTGSGWTGRTTFANSRGGFNSLDCVTAASCLATDQHGNALSFTGSTSWPRTAITEVGAHADCAGSFCMATTFGEGFRTRTNGSWSSLVVDGPYQPAVCASRTRCFALLGDSVNTWNGSSWSGLVDLPSDIGFVDRGADCPTTTFCLAVGLSGKTVSWGGARWVTRARAPLTTGGSAEVDCLSPSFCMAVSDADAAVLTASGWRATSKPPFGLKGLACRSTTMCLALQNGTVVAWDGTSWSYTSTAAQPGPALLSAAALRRNQSVRRRRRRTGLVDVVTARSTFTRALWVAALVATLLGTWTAPMSLASPVTGTSAEPPSSLAVAGSTAIAPVVPGAMHVIDPRRILDTRAGTGAAAGPRAGGSTTTVRVTGQAGVPSTGVGAVVAHVTVADATGNGHVTVFPSGAPLPTTSTLNFRAGQVVSNATTVPVGADGRISLRYTGSGTIRLIADIAAWTDAGRATEPGTTSAMTPARVMDTRTGLGGTRGPVAAGSKVTLRVAGRGGVPATVGSATLNVTVVGPRTAGWVAVNPVDPGAAKVKTSSLNFASGQTIANAVTTALSGSGTLDLRLSPGAEADLVVDVVAWSRPGAPTGEGAVVAHTPTAPPRHPHDRPASTRRRDRRHSDVRGLGLGPQRHGRGCPRLRSCRRCSGRRRNTQRLAADLSHEPRARRPRPRPSWARWRGPHHPAVQWRPPCRRRGGVDHRHDLGRRRHFGGPRLHGDPLTHDGNTTAVESHRRAPQRHRAPPRRARSPVAVPRGVRRLRDDGRGPAGRPWRRPRRQPPLRRIRQGFRRQLVRRVSRPQWRAQV